MQEILAKLKDVMQGILPGAGRYVVPETTISNIPSWDSLHSVTFQMFIEETFNKKVPLDLLEGESTIGDIARYLTGSGQ